MQRVEKRTKDVLNFYVSKRVLKNDKIGNFSKIDQTGFLFPNILARKWPATQASRSRPDISYQQAV